MSAENKISVLHVIDSLVPGGAEKIVYDLSGLGGNLLELYTVRGQKKEFLLRQVIFLKTHMNM